MTEGTYVFVHDENGRCLGAGRVAEVDDLRARVTGLSTISTLLGKMPDMDGQWFDVSRLETHSQDGGWGSSEGAA